MSSGDRSRNEGSPGSAPDPPAAPAPRPAPVGSPPGGQTPLDPDAVLAQSEMEFVRSSGPGGQHRNRRETGVRLTHLPTGIVAQATERRSQSQNRSLALERLVEKLEARRKRRKPRKSTRKGRGVLTREAEAKQRQAARKRARRQVDET